MAKPRSVYVAKEKKKKRPVKRPEQILQTHVMTYAMRVAALQKYKHFLCFHCPNGGGRSKAEAAIFKGMGVMAGVADIMVLLTPNDIHPYQTVIFIEMKAGKTVRESDLNQNQKDFRDNVQGMGFRYYVLAAENPRDAINKFIEIMKQNGVDL